MKILVVMNYRANFGGVTGAIEELVRSLQQENFRVDIISTHGRVTDRIKGIIKVFKKASRYDFIIGLGSADFSFLPAFVAVMAAKIYKKRILMDFHEGYPILFMKRFGRLIKLFLGKIPVTVASEYLFDIFKKYQFNVFLIPHHFHYEFFPEREKNFVWNKKIMWAGTFQFMYDPEIALKACKMALDRRDDLEFHFFGKGPLLEKLTKEYQHPKIIFEGFIPRNELLKKYQEYCVFLNTSFGDNFPLRLVEASFNELLVISTNFGGPPTIYTEQECLFFEKGDYKKLSEHILNVMENPQAYDYFRKNMHNKVMSFRWDKVKTKWLELIKTE